MNEDNGGVSDLNTTHRIDFLLFRGSFSMKVLHTVHIERMEASQSIKIITLWPPYVNILSMFISHDKHC